MIVSSLTKIGKAMIGDKDELSILLDEQKKNIRTKKLLDLVIDLDTSEIGSLNLSDYQALEQVETILLFAVLNSKKVQIKISMFSTLQI